MRCMEKVKEAERNGEGVIKRKVGERKEGVQKSG